MEFALIAILTCCAIGFPLIGHQMLWNPASFFAVVGATYAILGVFYFLGTRYWGTEIAGENSQFYDTYYVVSRRHFYLNMALYMLLPAALLWLQARLKVILFRRSTIGIFWAINLGTLIGVVVAKIMKSIVIPKLDVDYEAAFNILNLVTVWSTFIVQVALGLLVILFFVSVILRRKKGMEPS